MALRCLSAVAALVAEVLVVAAVVVVAEVVAEVLVAAALEVVAVLVVEVVVLVLEEVIIIAPMVEVTAVGVVVEAAVVGAGHIGAPGGQLMTALLPAAHIPSRVI